MKNLLYILLFALFLFSCEDKVDLSKKLDSGKTALVVDAFLSNVPENQIVNLSTTQYYFDNSGPKMATGAAVQLVDLTNSNTYIFTEGKKGEYVSPLKGDSMLKIGNSYQLQVSYNGENYVAFSTVNRVTTLDTIKFEPATDFSGNLIQGKYDAEFNANDIPGPGDRYLIRHYKNDVRSLEISHIGLAYDASSFSTQIIDGDPFDYPLRFFTVNEQDVEKKWKDGEKMKVEILSITDEAASFLSQVITQSSLGEGGGLGALFSSPPANVPTNIKNSNENGSKAVGFFCTSAVSWGQTTVPNKAIRKP